MNPGSRPRLFGLPNLEFPDTDDPDDANDAAFVPPRESARRVWFWGSDQSRLNYRYVGGPEPFGL
jgi:hypothetical protein